MHVFVEEFGKLRSVEVQEMEEFKKSRRAELS
jgi:hypothetical protein